MSQMENLSGLEPRGTAVLVRPYEPEKKAGLIAIPDSVKTRVAMLEQRATVVAIGPSSWQDEPEPRAQVGDRVLVSAYAGTMAVGPGDGVQYRLINARDIFCRITHEGNENG